MNDDAARTQFKEQGYFVVPKLLNDDEVHFYRQRLQALGEIEPSGSLSRPLPGQTHKSLDQSWKLPDGVTKVSDFWPLIVHDQLLVWVRKLLGEDIRYLQHSDLHVGRSSVSWHRDSVNRTFGKGAEWDLSGAPYRLVRCALYLQTFDESGFRLGLLPGSHRPESPVSLRRRWNELNVKLLALTSRLSPKAQGLGLDATWIKAQPGDVIIFDPRILHAGSYITGPKYSIFVGFGIESSHFWKHRNYYRYVREDLGYEDPSVELVARLKEANLYAEDPGNIINVDDAWVPNRITKKHFVNKRG
jgi:hypothetical protein